MEVGNLREHTGMKKTILATDISVFSLDVEKKLQESQFLVLRGHSS
jgi:hypothetical protein